MGKNVKNKVGHRVGKVKGVFQKYNTRLKAWQKYDRTTGHLVSTKKSAGPYKGVAKE
jgi:hypothetical protein